MLEWLLSSLPVDRFVPGRRLRSELPDATRLASKAASVPSFRDTLSEFGAELARARRYERPLSMLVATVHHQPGEENGGPPPGSAQRSPSEAGPRVSHPVALLAGWLLSEVLRVSDIVTYDPAAQRFVILLPESDDEEALRAVRRIGRMLWDRMSVRTRAGMALFPDDGLTVSRLVEQAEADLHLDAGESAP